jgi:hypothetical protein
MARRHGVEAALEHPYIALTINAYPDDLSPMASIHGLGKRRPALHETIRIRQFSWTWILGLLGQCCHYAREDSDNSCYGFEYDSTCTRHPGSPIGIQNSMLPRNLRFQFRTWQDSIPALLAHNVLRQNHGYNTFFVSFKDAAPLWPERGINARLAQEVSISELR